MALRAFGHWLAYQHLPPGDFTAGVRGPKIARRPPRFLNEDQIAQAIDLAGKHGIATEVTLAIYSGLRLSELRRLQWRDIDFTARTITVQDTKANRVKVVPLHRKAAEALTAHRVLTGSYDWVFPGGRLSAGKRGAGGGWSANRPRRMNTWLRLLRPLQDAMPIFRAIHKGSVSRGWHLFRHTFASQLVQQRVDIKRVSEWMGHSTVITTEKFYAYLKPGYDADIERLA